MSAGTVVGLWIWERYYIVNILEDGTYGFFTGTDIFEPEFGSFSEASRFTTAGAEESLRILQTNGYKRKKNASKLVQKVADSIEDKAYQLQFLMDNVTLETPENVRHMEL